LVSLGRVASVLAGLVAVVAILSMLSALLSPSAPSGPDRNASILADDDPVAVISPLPDYVSNGTWWTLDGSESQGIIVAYLWNVTLGGETTVLHGSSEIYMFKTLGLYKITLTVTDNQTRRSTAFTAVVSVLDSDQDTLPDWWEGKYPRPTFIQMVKEKWTTAVGIVAVSVAGVVLLLLLTRKRLRKREKAKIEAAIAIEKALESEDS
jgi:hypothetical protein